QIACAQEDGVVDVRDVLNVGDFATRIEPPQTTHQRVEVYKREGVTEVRRVVRGNATRVQLDRTIRHGLARRGQCVAQEQGHVSRSELTIRSCADVPRGRSRPTARARVGLFPRR